MSANQPRVEFHRIYIDQCPGPYLVAKVGRVSSPPVRTEVADDPRAVVRLLEVFRCGTATWAYTDYAAFKRRQGEDPAREWMAYVRAVCAVAGVDRLNPLALGALPVPSGIRSPAARVTYHQAVMNDRPYVVARVRSVLGAPAPVLLLDYPAESARNRLADVFRIGSAGTAFADRAVELEQAGAATHG